MADSNGSRNRPASEVSQHASTPPGGSPVVDPVAVIRSRHYIGALVLAAILGIPFRPSRTASWHWSQRFRNLYLPRSRTRSSAAPRQPGGPCLGSWYRAY